MVIDISESQFDYIDKGKLSAPDGAVYLRRSSRAKRRECDAHLASGGSIAIYDWAQGRLDWADSTDAQNQWQLIRSQFTHELVSNGKKQWTAGVWHSDDNEIFVFSAHC